MAPLPLTKPVAPLPTPSLQEVSGEGSKERLAAVREAAMSIYSQLTALLELEGGAWATAVKELVEVCVCGGGGGGTGAGGGREWRSMEAGASMSTGGVTNATATATARGLTVPQLQPQPAALLCRLMNCLVGALSAQAAI